LIKPLSITITLLLGFFSLSAQIDYDSTIIHTDTLSKVNNIKNKFNFGLTKKSNSDSANTVNYRNIYGFIGIKDTKEKSFAWYIDKKTYDLIVTKTFDSTLFLNHLILPGQKNMSFVSYLGNMGSPLIPDHFFDRYEDVPFLFSSGFAYYQQPVLERRHFNVRRPHTQIDYSTGGSRKNAEQNLLIMHTQNVNRYTNIGLQYNYYSTKGIYENQLTRNNDFTFFASYYKHRLMAQGTFAYTYIKNQENGGLLDDKFIQDTVVEPNLVPFSLKKASTEYRKRSFSGVVGYDIIALKTTDSDTNKLKSILAAKLIFEGYRYTRLYVDAETDSSYFKNFYINTSSTHDSVYLATYQSTLLVELSQIAKYPGIPGLRAWVSNLFGSYYYLTPEDFIYSQNNKKINTNHFGFGIYSNSPYLNYSGAARFFLSGYRSADKELFGRLSILPWKSKEMPFISGELSITDREPDPFLKQYFSNHYKWNNNFDKESRFRISAKIGAEKIGFEAGYNLVHILNYIYFDTLALPTQASNVTVTSAYLQKVLKLGGLHLVGKAVWQAITNTEAMGLPTLLGFGALYYQYPLVKNVLTVQLGISAFYRTPFYADVYNPATGIFHRQKDREIGNYPYADVFLNAKWKRTNLFFKFEHVNQGYPDNQYFISVHYPYNPRMFKFGLSWMFYD